VRNHSTADTPPKVEVNELWWTDSRLHSRIVDPPYGHAGLMTSHFSLLFFGQYRAMAFAYLAWLDLIPI
jgi:hypothetical protein